MNKVVELNDVELAALILESDKPVFIDFYADWCGPCKMVSPVMEELAKEYSRITFVKINVDENPESTTKYGIRSIPTFLIIKEDQIQYRHSGAAPKSFFAEKLSSYMK